MHWFFAILLFAIAIWNLVVGIGNMSPEPGVWILNIAVAIVLSFMGGNQVARAMDDF